MTNAANKFQHLLSPNNAIAAATEGLIGSYVAQFIVRKGAAFVLVRNLDQQFWSVWRMCQVHGITYGGEVDNIVRNETYPGAWA